MAYQEHSPVRLLGASGAGAILFWIEDSFAPAEPDWQGEGDVKKDAP